MKNKNIQEYGFTLVELLAVFIVLGIIAGIAIFSLNGIREDYEKRVFIESVKGLIDASQQKYANEDYIDFPTNGLTPSDLNVENVKQYTSGLIKYEDGKFIAVNVSNGAYCVNGTIDNLELVSGSCDNTYNYYANGNVIYLNPVSGKICSGYTEENSILGVNTGCLKWYSFNDTSEKETLSLLLDHNIASDITFNNINDSLNSLVSDWSSALNTRLITADEIVLITSNNTWKSSSATSLSYYFDSNSASSSLTCREENTTGCTYGWLYDRTNIYCKQFGCLNHSEEYNYGYWTSTEDSRDSSMAWIITYDGRLDSISKNSIEIALRPIITVNKSIFN